MPSLEPGLPGEIQKTQLLPPLIVIVGPTAVGKTEAAIVLAQRLQGEIVSADSKLFYRGMDIGTAKPSIIERRGIPHHLIDIADPDQSLSLAVFQMLAHTAIHDIHARGRLPILVGGTGQYARAVLEGWESPAVVANPRLRAALETWAQQIGTLGLHARLAALDPVAAAQIDHRNLRRTVRALEVILTTGRTFSDQRKQGQPLYCPLLIGLTRPRTELYARIDERIDSMIQSGLIREVTGLLERGYSATLPALSAIGYREIIAYLQGTLTLEAAIIQMKRQTRVFVRRQTNWFKPDDPQIHWLQVHDHLLAEMETQVRDWLKSPIERLHD